MPLGRPPLLNIHPINIAGLPLTAPLALAASLPSRLLHVHVKVILLLRGSRSIIVLVITPAPPAPLGWPPALTGKLLTTLAYRREADSALAPECPLLLLILLRRLTNFPELPRPPGRVEILPVLHCRYPERHQAAKVDSEKTPTVRNAPDSMETQHPSPLPARISIHP